ncbi:hypothetical protein AB9F41_34275, partial [Rhizobium leguminosarum]|uniref:hypothetical protein n=1 Tax=Rhizobium leguminosarum TaxID=384 RepID=UPI003F9CFEEA
VPRQKNDAAISGGPSTAWAMNSSAPCIFSGLIRHGRKPEAVEIRSVVPRSIRAWAKRNRHVQV